MESKKYTESTKYSQPEKPETLGYKSSICPSEDLPDIVEAVSTPSYYSTVDGKSLMEANTFEIVIITGNDEIVMEISTVEAFRTQM